MSAQTIYIQLVRGGLSPVGACAVMGNMQAESAMRAVNVQDGYGYTDEDYTASVDAGLMDFAGDAIGYGLIQWTYGPRKRKLLEYARSRGVSIGDEAMQVDFCLKELREDYPSLFAFLCVTTGVYEAARRVCLEYERPANAAAKVAERAGYADSFFMTLEKLDVSRDESESEAGEIPTPSPEKPAQGSVEAQGEKYWPPRQLRRGDKGPDVTVLQALLVARGWSISIDGDFGSKTEAALEEYEASLGLIPVGETGILVWPLLLDRG